MSILDSVLRFVSRKVARVHFSLVTSRKKSSVIPPSGKVLDGDDLEAMIDASLDMWLTAGRYSDLFEAEFATVVGVKYALAVNSGSSANLLAISALTSPKLGDRRLVKGDEVITVAAGFPATITPIIQNGLIPVFVDVTLPTYDIDIAQIESSVTPRTKAIMVAHTLGNPFDLQAIMALAKRHNLWLIEDNCDALGATYNGQKTGTFGDIATCSFYPAHHMTMGEGGAVMTSNRELYKILMSFRDWGRDCWCLPGCDNTCQNRFGWSLGKLPKGYDHKYIYSHLGYNLKITDWQAALGLSQLKKLSRFVAARRERFDWLTELLQPYTAYLDLPVATPNSEPSWFGYLITVKPALGKSKHDLVTWLDKHGIGTRPLFAGNFLRHPASLNNPFELRLLNGPIQWSTELTDSDFAKLPVTERILEDTFWVGVWPGLTRADIERVATIIGQFCSK